MVASKIVTCEAESTIASIRRDSLPLYRIDISTSGAHVRPSAGPRQQQSTGRAEI